MYKHAMGLMLVVLLAGLNTVACDDTDPVKSSVLSLRWFYDQPDRVTDLGRGGAWVNVDPLGGVNDSETLSLSGEPGGVLITDMWAPPRVVVVAFSFADCGLDKNGNMVYKGCHIGNDTKPPLTAWVECYVDGQFRKRADIRNVHLRSGTIGQLRFDSECSELTVL